MQEQNVIGSALIGFLVGNLAVLIFFLDLNGTICVLVYLGLLGLALGLAEHFAGKP